MSAVKRSAAQISGTNADEPNKARKLSATGVNGVHNGMNSTFMPTLAPAMEREMPEACPECGSDDIIENWQQGNAECRGCGLVLAERLLDLGSEWRTFTQEEGDDPNRVGGPANPLLEGDLGTDIGAGGKGGNRLAAALHRAQQRNATSAADKLMISVMGRIDRMCERLSFMAANKRAKELFKGYQNHLTLRTDGTRTRSLRDEETTEIIAASIFIACRNLGAARTYKEVCALTGIARKIIGATVKKIELAIPGAKTSLVRSTDDFVTRFCTRLNLPREVINAADKLSKTVNDNELYGKTYTTVAAASIYVITQLCKKEDKKTPAEIAQVTGVAEVTIRSTYKLMYPHLAKSLPKDFKPHEPFKSLPSP